MKNKHDVKKQTGAHYTPTELSDFVAFQIVKNLQKKGGNRISILDPAIGDGELIVSLVRELKQAFPSLKMHVTGFDINNKALEVAQKRILGINNDLEINLFHKDFINEVTEKYSEQESLFGDNGKKYDLIISNPPYVRTQVLGAKRSSDLAKKFSIEGRVDLYHAFIIASGMALKPGGIAGIIVSNRFMTTRSGVLLRTKIKNMFDILHIWDMGDTQLFEAAVLPAVLLLRRKNISNRPDLVAKLTAIYSCPDFNQNRKIFESNNLFDSIEKSGFIKLNKKIFEIKQGTLGHTTNSSEVWRISNSNDDNLLSRINKNTYCKFRDLGNIRVGVKTTADKVFIRKDWYNLPNEKIPELLRPLVTHHVANRFKSDRPKTYILYTHEVVNGKRRCINLENFPKAKRYLEDNKKILSSRTYIKKSRRNWYEIWVPQDPERWKYPKIVFRDISEKPVFWIDLDGMIVNGDCYWLSCEDSSKLDLLWLALAISNSKFIELFYDLKFNNKLYSGRRRFITQYVNEFPLPNPNLIYAKKLISLARKAYSKASDNRRDSIESEIDILVAQSFGLTIKEISR